MWLKEKFHIKSNEAVANKYLINSMSITILVLIFVWVLNILGIFRVDNTVMAGSVLICIAVYALGMGCWCILGINKSCVKYLMILWAVIIVTIFASGLTFHALVATVLPILFCTLYSSKRMMAFTYILMVLSTIAVVYVGYYVGICDANMTLLPGDPLSAYIGIDGEFTNTHINDQVSWTLMLFFVLPRCMIYATCMLVTYNIAKIIRHNEKRARNMETLAEVDGMTGLYNKTKYISSCQNIYELKEKIAVIYWDVNNLKIVNDTQGHEEGDLLIRTVAKSIKTVTDIRSKAYRVGGDEFVMIMTDAGEREVLAKIEEWHGQLNAFKEECPIELSVSLGYAYGKGSDLKEIIKAADAMMYANKKKFHEQYEK